MASPNLLILTLKRTPNSAGTLSPNEYLLSVSSLPGHDYATVRSQSGLDAPDEFYYNGNQQRLNIGGYFIKGSLCNEINPDNGLTDEITTFYCNRAFPGFEDVTEGNAYERYNASRLAHAQAIGVVEYYNWHTEYVQNNFTTIHTATTTVTEQDIEWWLEHEINWADPALNKPAV